MKFFGQILFCLALLAACVDVRNPEVGNTSPSASTRAVIPSAPTGLTANPGNQQVGLSWSPPIDNGGSAITDYTIQYSSNSGSSWTDFADGVSPETSATVTGLTNGTEYTFQVAAMNPAGAGSFAPTESIVPRTVPGNPTQLTVVPENEQVTLTWLAPSDNGGAAITDYLVEYSADSGQSWNLFDDGVSTLTTATITGLTSGTEYVFRVNALNVVGSGSSSQNSSNFTPVTTPGAPSSVTGTAGDAQVSLSWTAPSSNGGSAITDYIVQYSINGGSWTTFNDGTSTSTSATVTGLTNGSAYTFQVAAINAAGTGIHSASSLGVTPATTPGAPTNVTGTAGASQVLLSWTAPASTGGSAITDYVIQVKPASGGAWTTFSDGTSTSTSATVTGLTNGAAHIFQVAAVNGVGQGSYSASSSSVTPYTTPGAPTGVSGTSGNTQVSLSWTAPSSNGGSAITDYVVQYSINGGSWTTFNDGTSTSTSATVTGLTNGSAYTFQVAAINAAGTGIHSASSLGVTPATTPGAPTNVTGTAGASQVLLSWTAPASTGGSAITDYIVQYKLTSSGTWSTFADGTSSNTTATITGLANASAYDFQVAAVNATGLGAFAQSSSITPRGSFISTWKTDNMYFLINPSGYFRSDYDCDIWIVMYPEDPEFSYDECQGVFGSSGSKQITLPLESGGVYNFTVNWGDGTQNTITSGTDPNRTHTYATAGTYTVTIDGTINGFRFDHFGDRLKITGISQFGTLNLGNNGGYFNGARNLTISATDGLDLTGTTNLSNAFADCNSLTTAPSMANWDMSNVTDLSGMFRGARSFNQNIGSWNTVNITNMSSMFGDALAFNQNIGSWNTANVTNMGGMFSRESGYTNAFNQPIGNWDVSKVTNMSYMFGGFVYLSPTGPPFNQDISNWNVSNVTDMSGMFHSAGSFNQPIGNWNVSNVINMDSIFMWATNFNQDISNWNVSNVTNTRCMFYGVGAFNQAIGNWNVSNVRDMSSMFGLASAFNQPIGNWNTANVTSMYAMFERATAFNQNIGNWNTANVTDMGVMFGNASAFNQNLDAWNVANVTSMMWMFFSAGLTRTNYDPILLGWSAQNVKTDVVFDAGSAKYSGSTAVTAARSILTTGKGWTITDGGAEAVVPGSPTGVGGTSGNTQVSLSWTAPSDNGGSAITDYVVQVKPASGGAWTTFSDGTSTSTSAVVTGLTNGTAYIFQVAAVNAAGTGSYSSSSSSVTPYTTPGAPTGVAGTSGNTQVSLSWTAPSDNGGALITDYAIQYSSNGGAWITFTDGVSTGTSTVVTGLANGTEYIFQVAAINSVGTGTSSASSLGVTPVTNPGAPTSVTGTAGDGQVSLSWTAPSSNGGSAITDYFVQYSSNNGTDWTTFSDGTSTSTSATVTGLTNGTAYVFQVAAVNAVGQGSFSQQSSSVTPQTTFVSTWKTDNTSSGSSTSSQVKLPLESTGTYNFTVDWGDGTSNTITTWNDANTTHTYASAGTYTVTIYGTIRGFRFDNGGDKLKITNISSFGPLRLGNNGSYFYGASNLTITATDALDLTGTTNLYAAFAACTSLTTAPSMASWDTSGVTNMASLFSQAIAFNQNIGSWNTSNVTDMSQMFYVANAFNQDIGTWNTANVTKMTWMFKQARAFNQNIGGWNTAKVTDMSRLFELAIVFNQPLGNWNTSNVTDMSFMFAAASVFNQEIGNWNVANVTNMFQMFAYASAFNKPIGNWNVSNVTQMSAMFQVTPFNQDIGSWNVANVTDMGQMFYVATAFNQNISNWNVANVTNMAQMFTNAPFNQDIGSWNVANVTDMGQMFRASTFDQNIGNWNVTKVTEMSNMFLWNTAFSRTNYDALLLGWSGQNVKTGVTFSAYNTKYSLSSAVVAARAALSPGKSWTITDGGGEAVSPGAPTSVSGTAGSSQVSLSWTAPSDNGGSAITDYVIQYSTDGSSWTTFSDGTSTDTTATVTGLNPGTAYTFQVAAVNAQGTGSYSASSASVTPIAPSCSGDCYTEAGVGVGAERLGPGGSTITLQYANGSSGFLIWQEKNGNRILNSTGLIANGWQRALTRAGTAFDGDLTSSAVISTIVGRVCPTHVFINHSNMTTTGKCLYYDSAFYSQSLSKDWTGGAIESEDYIANAFSAGSGRGSAASFYEGNVKTCADKGMRLPTMYETTMNQPGSNVPAGDGIAPTWAGSNGVPSSGWSWTASNSGYSQYYFWLWNGVYSANMGYNADSGYSVRCVLPSH